MKTIIITLPGFFEGETQLVNALFEQGMERLHLRKPKSTEKEMAEWIDQIDLPFRHRIVLHDHHELARKFELGGIHLNSRNPEAPLWTKEIKEKREFTVSRSCHSIEEVLCNKTMDYVTLSPIYDSISKEGYGATFSHEELVLAFNQGKLSDKVFALGGISAEHLLDVKEIGFSGAAILGDLWRKEGEKVSPELCLNQLQKILMQASILC